MNYNKGFYTSMIFLERDNFNALGKNTKIRLSCESHKKFYYTVLISEQNLSYHNLDINSNLLFLSYTIHTYRSNTIQLVQFII